MPRQGGQGGPLTSPAVRTMGGITPTQERRSMSRESSQPVTPCTPDTATRHTGYLVGGTSPFGTRKPLPVYAEATLFDLPQIWINAGRRGLLVRIAPAALEQVLHEGTFLPAGEKAVRLDVTKSRRETPRGVSPQPGRCGRIPRVGEGTEVG